MGDAVGHSMMRQSETDGIERRARTRGVECQDSAWMKQDWNETVLEGFWGAENEMDWVKAVRKELGS